MKYKVILLSVVALLFFSASGFVWKKSPTPKQGPILFLEEMGERVTEILKNKDSNAYTALFLTAEELKPILEKSPGEKSEQQGILKKFQGEPYSNYIKQSYRELQQLLAEGKVDLNKISFLRSNIEIQDEFRTIGGNLEYCFEFNGRPYEFRVRKILKTAKGWKLTKGIQLKGVVTQEEFSAMQRMIMDSLLADSTKRADEMMMQMQTEISRLADSIAAAIQLEADSAQKAQEAEKQYKEDKKKKKKGKS